MKNNKIILLFIMFAIMSSLFAEVEKRRLPRYTMKDLTDPQSPSYVPYPFPKDRFEILEDFKYGIKKTRWYKSPGNDIFLLEKEGISVNKIVRVEEKYLRAPYFYYYLFHVKRDGAVAGIAAVNEFGLVMGTRLIETDEQRKRETPFKDKEQAEKMVEDNLGTIRIDKITFVHRVSDICTKFAPMWEVETSGGTFFVDRRDEIWAVDFETQATDEKIRKRTKEGVLDEEKDLIRFLRKVEKR
jgi:hypothetical protein